MKNQLPIPETQIQEVLYDLLTHQITDTFSLIERYYILNATARISDLRTKYNLNIDCIPTVRHNKWGRKIKAGLFRLYDKEKGREIYLKMRKNEVRN